MVVRGGVRFGMVCFGMDKVRQGIIMEKEKRLSVNFNLVKFKRANVFKRFLRHFEFPEECTRSDPYNTVFGIWNDFIWKNCTATISCSSNPLTGEFETAMIVKGMAMGMTIRGEETKVQEIVDSLKHWALRVVR
jgi:hypothetical protein